VVSTDCSCFFLMNLLWLNASYSMYYARRFHCCDQRLLVEKSSCAIVLTVLFSFQLPLPFRLLFQDHNPPSVFFGTPAATFNRLKLDDALFPLPSVDFQKKQLVRDGCDGSRYTMSYSSAVSAHVSLSIIMVLAQTPRCSTPASETSGDDSDSIVKSASSIVLELACHDSLLPSNLSL
jgi:hypothetical protein